MKLLKPEQMTRDELKEYLPHREPMLLIDRINIDEE